MSEADDQLVERLRGGDTEALGLYIESRRNQLLAFIARNLSTTLATKVEPTDLLQEVTIHALKSLQDIDFGDRDPFNWLCQVAERRIIDAHRKYIGAQKRSTEKEVAGNAAAGTGSSSGQGGLIDMLVVTMTTPSQAFSRNQREFKLQEGLAQLPKESQEALRLRYVEGLPTKEIAQKLGKSDGSVRVLLSRSLSKLQGILGPDVNPLQRK